MSNRQPWMGKPWVDVVFILLPPVACLAFITLFPQLFADGSEISVVWWVALVLLIDVAHVYSTLYRTYLDPHALKTQRGLLWAIPLLCFLAGALVYSFNPLLFWRLLAYVAVYHFVRQQYGFMRVYSRRERQGRRGAMVDAVTIYAAAIYPLLYWHFSGPRNFNWFINGDFLYLSWPAVLPFLTTAYFLVLAAYAVKETLYVVRTRRFNLPRNGVVIGTALSWYFGIVHFNGDLAFTLLNVVSHGVPYMALVWLHGRKSYAKPEGGSRFLRAVFSRYGVILFVGLIVLFAFVEEGLWDVAVWKEHRSVFGGLGDGFAMPAVALNVLVPLLAVPQLTHYILDGFIWKIRAEEFKWSSEVTKA